MEIVLMKGAGNVLVPADEESAEHVTKLKLGQGVRVKLTNMRGYKFHQKFFCLLNYAFDIWEPTERKYKGIVVKTGEGNLLIQYVQIEAKKPFDTDAFLCGHKIPIGYRFEP